MAPIEAAGVTVGDGQHGGGLSEGEPATFSSTPVSRRLALPIRCL
jgi:hypothetical protein